MILKKLIIIIELGELSKLFMTISKTLIKLPSLERLIEHQLLTFCKAETKSHSEAMQMKTNSRMASL